MSYQITASMVGTITGLNPFETPDQLWYRLKTDQFTETTPAMERGLILEPYLINLASKTLGREYRKNDIVFTKGFLSGTPDAFSPQHSVLEIKTTTKRLDDKIPLHYFSQVQMYLYLTDIPIGYLVIYQIPDLTPNLAGVLASSVDFNDLVLDQRVHTIEYHSEFVNKSLELTEMFIKSLEMDNPPSNDEFKLPKNLVFDIAFPNAIEADTELINLIEKYKVLRDQAAELDSQLSELRSQIQSRLSDKEYVVYNDEPVVSWTRYEISRFDTNKFKRDYPELYEKYLQKSVQRTFRVK